LVVHKSRERIAVLESKLDDLKTTIRELRRIEHEALSRLKAKRARAAHGRRFVAVTGDSHEGRLKP
jgi:hypothetical protein